MNIDNLIIDKYFSIYNRNGFEYIINNKVKSKCKIYLIDFNNVKKMNKDIGYLNVNNIFKNTFSLLKKDYIIGRAFSGDEIFFLTNDINDKIDKIKKVCNDNSLKFKYIECIYNNDIELNIFLEKMIEKFR
jgi:GGDEF domain-containing protein